DADDKERAAVVAQSPCEPAEASGHGERDDEMEVAVVREAAPEHEVECGNRGVAEQPPDDRVTELVEERLQSLEGDSQQPERVCDQRADDAERQKLELVGTEARRV